MAILGIVSCLIGWYKIRKSLASFFGNHMELRLDSVARTSDHSFVWSKPVRCEPMESPTTESMTSDHLRETIAVKIMKSY